MIIELIVESLNKDINHNQTTTDPNNNKPGIKNSGSNTYVLFGDDKTKEEPKEETVRKKSIIHKPS